MPEGTINKELRQIHLKKEKASPLFVLQESFILTVFTYLSWEG